MFAEGCPYAAGVGFIMSQLSHPTLGIGASLQHKAVTVRVLVILLEVMLVVQNDQRVLIAFEPATGHMGTYRR